jgi:transposase
MILSSAIRAYVYTEAVDMRKSIDALSQLVSLGTGMNPLSGQVFVFIGRRRDKAKLLVWDRHGFWVLYKRLEAGRFTDPARLGADGIAMSELIAWLEGIDLSRTRRLQVVAATVVA